ncbi:hypothetical protein VITFI_CDS3244 [Vitreoscilla filiformis]|jgi:hypothetical protein|uniref:Uncharacterized protein n=1 Tax=Vitreoscilla filiformis TaxID=63 RepID=A0A221KCX2_VITFI|nr:hypothetical protein [Vitreoscilla filiformis]ASM75876.1 hypothetical protein VITFI_CDS0097 [Vitreoscilla filiformis]ASM76450.1 hypothetical protein VITFI_CDS0671 [Vitreoscilla filiformis]ASM76825.1 hypothetical protein VITFI_CDS1047 [Vitreoscilla filiformis]ASM77325.1 hypothetical protein VITFI_CDS1547 [Vitreoscilla filiformis]ASM79021.1 hypothetical protein VITFI_CDS3244 [Vitreoscilla filiformis]
MANQSDVLIAARAEALRSLLTAGPARLKIYTGAAPATPQTAATGTLLADLVMSATVAAPVAGVLTVSATADATVAASGTAGWARLSTSAGAALLDMSVGIAGSGHEVILSAVALYAGGFVRLTSLTLT